MQCPNIVYMLYYLKRIYATYIFSEQARRDSRRAIKNDGHLVGVPRQVVNLCYCFKIPLREGGSPTY